MSKEEIIFELLEKSKEFGGINTIIEFLNNEGITDINEQKFYIEEILRLEKEIRSKLFPIDDDFITDFESKFFELSNLSELGMYDIKMYQMLNMLKLKEYLEESTPRYLSIVRDRKIKSVLE